MHSPRYAVALVASALALLLPTTAHGAVTDPEGPSGSPAPAQRGAPEDRNLSPRHSSDGVVGEIAPPIPPGQRGRATERQLRSWRVTPGVRARTWQRTDARGPVRFHLLRIDLATKGLRLDYARRGPVTHAAPLTRILAQDKAVAGVNGDFFDIGVTGAPLGTGLDRERGLLHGRVATWNETFSVARNGTPRIGTLPMTTTIRQHPGVTITNLNSPFVMPAGIGAYTRQFGPSPGYRATQGQVKDVRAVQILGGRVASKSRRLPTSGAVRGTLLVGRGPGAQALGRLRIGERLTLRRRIQGDPQMAITGNVMLLKNRQLNVVDDREMHPRTAVGIDRTTGEVLLLAVDGRQSFSRGQTMVELARTMRRLGAETALNLDGGGSTSLVAKRPSGSVGVVNSPSDGGLRPVADALEVLYRRRR